MTTKTTTYAGFDSWAEVLNWCGTGAPIFYHAPMDYRPARVQVHVYKNHKVRVYPPTNDADAFTADAGHLSRFRRELAQVRPEVSR